MGGRIGVFFKQSRDVLGRGTKLHFCYYHIPDRFGYFNIPPEIGKLVRVVPVPGNLTDADFGNSGQQKFVGYITVLDRTADGRRVAIETEVFPKSGLPNKSESAKKLGAYLEALAAEHVKRRGIRRIRTALPEELQNPQDRQDQSESRRGQLSKLGLPLDREEDIDVWISKMWSGAAITRFGRLQTARQWLAAKLNGKIRF